MNQLNKIHCMDCVIGLEELEPESVDFILTDPPFNVGVDYHGTDDSMSDDEYFRWCSKWINALYEPLKVGRYAIIFSGDKKLYHMHKAVTDSSFTFHHFLKWNKPNGQRALSGTVFFYRTELAFVLSKGKPNTKCINRKVIYSDTLTHSNTSPNEFNSSIHNCRRPIPLYAQLINGFTQPNEVVLDCFMGSGTTAVASKQTNRNFIGYEINPDYVEAINRRLEQKTLTDKKWFEVAKNNER